MSIWMIAIIGLLGGFVPGVLFVPWLVSPFGPGAWFLSEALARVHMTISQVIRGRGAIVRRQDGSYEHGTYDPKRSCVQLSDTTVPVDNNDLSWGLFGKRPLTLTWEAGTDIHERVRTDSTEPGLVPVTDGGAHRLRDRDLEIDMGAAHRLLRGVNESDEISRTEEKAEAEYGGAGDDLDGVLMGVLVGVMLVLGTLTTFMML